MDKRFLIIQSLYVFYTFISLLLTLPDHSTPCQIILKTSFYSTAQNWVLVFNTHSHALMDTVLASWIALSTSFLVCMMNSYSSIKTQIKYIFPYKNFSQCWLPICASVLTEVYHTTSHPLSKYFPSSHCVLGIGGYTTEQKYIELYDP